MRFEEFTEDGSAKLNEHILHLSQVSLALRLSQDAKAHLHSLDIITIGTHGRDLALLGLMLLEKRADNEDRVYRHLLVGQAKVTLCLHGELGKRDSQATR